MGAGSAHRQHETQAALLADHDLTELLGLMIKKVDPESYQRMKVAYDAGNWIGTPIPAADHKWGVPPTHSCMLGQATLYKLDTGCHIDERDDWCVTVAGGMNYEGGEALFPDLGLKLK